MAVDLTFDTFSKNLFQYMWRNLCAIDICDAPGQDEKFPSSAFSGKIFKAVHTRIQLLCNYNMNYFKRNYHQFSEYPTDFYICLQNTFHSRSYIRHLNIFDKFLNICEIAVMMGYTCFCDFNPNGMELAICSCAMFLDAEIKDGFYDAGGWEELKKHVHIYENILMDVPFTSDLENAFDMFLTASINYDMDILINISQNVLARLSEHSKNVIYCPKCSLLLPGIRGIVFPEEFCSESIDVIEGLLQIVLSIKSFEKLSANTSKRSEKVIETLTDAKTSDYANLEKEIKTSYTQINKSGLSETDYRTVNTLEFIIELFGKMEPETKEFGLCKVCLKSLNKSPEHLIKDGQTAEVKCVKLNILNEVNKCDLGECSSNSVGSQADILKSVSKHAIKEATNIEPNPTLCHAIKKMSISEQDASPENTTNTESLKDILRLFIGLGIEPVKTQILSGLKNKYIEFSENKIGLEENYNLQESCDFASTSTNQGLKVTHKHKNKKRTKKKKTVKVNKNIV